MVTLNHFDVGLSDESLEVFDVYTSEEPESILVPKIVKGHLIGSFAYNFQQICELDRL